MDLKFWERSLKLLQFRNPKGEKNYVYSIKSYLKSHPLLCIRAYFELVYIVKKRHLAIIYCSCSVQLRNTETFLQFFLCFYKSLVPVPGLQ